jgi:hypothetical protein
VSRNTLFLFKIFKKDLPKYSLSVIIKAGVDKPTGKDENSRWIRFLRLMQNTALTVF